MTTSVATSGNRTYAAIAYILSWITGLIIYFIAEKTDRYARWHAIQAIGLGIVLTVIAIIISILGIPYLNLLFNLAALVLTIFLAVKAYNGEKIRIPTISDYADKHA